MNDDDAPVFPAKLYLFNEDGTYDGYIPINSDAHLRSPVIKAMIVGHMKLGREVRLTDPMDNCLFHANNGKIIFPVEGS